MHKSWPLQMIVALKELLLRHLLNHKVMVRLYKKIIKAIRVQ